MRRLSIFTAVCALGLLTGACGASPDPTADAGVNGADAGATDAGGVDGGLDGGTDAGVDGGVTPPTTITLQGTLVDGQGKPAAGQVALNWDFDHAHSVGADGRFTFEDVTPPYDLSASDGATLVELTGLHRSDLRIPLQLNILRHAVIAGTITSDYGDTHTNAGEALYLSVAGGAFIADSLTNFTFSETAQWYGPSSLQGDLVALQVKYSAGQTYFQRAGVLPEVTLTDGAVLTGLAFAFDNESPVLTVPTQIEGTFGTYLTNSAAYLHSVQVSGAGFFLNASLPLSTLVDIPVDGAQAELIGKDAQGRSAAVVRRIEPGTINTFSLSGVGTLNATAPANAATNVSLIPTLQWSFNGTADEITVAVYEAGTSTPILYAVLPPDATEFTLPASSTGAFHLKPGTEYGWQITATQLEGFGSESLADPSNDLGLAATLFGAQDVTLVASEPRSFTTAP